MNCKKCNSADAVESYRPALRFSYCEQCIRSLILSDRAGAARMVPAEELEMVARDRHVSWCRRGQPPATDRDYFDKCENNACAHVRDLLAACGHWPTEGEK